MPRFRMGWRRDWRLYLIEMTGAKILRFHFRLFVGCVPTHVAEKTQKLPLTSLTP